jgi:ribulose-bisphosphate carboxylase large chain
MSGVGLEITYGVQSSAAEIAARAEALLLEQTVELPRSALRTPFIRDRMVGKVLACEPMGGWMYRVTVEQPVETTALDPAQFLNVVFGNSSLQPDIELLDIKVPVSLAHALGGPRLGIPGIRRATGVTGRALTASAVKPMGLTAAEAGDLCRTLALAGIDLVKDDHGLADHAFCPFEDRVRACLDATRDAAETTGRRTLYVPNLIGTPSTVLRQAAQARDLGAGAVMVSPMLVGLPLLSELAGTLGIPILAHPSFGGALRIAPPALLGRIFPLFGADAVIYPNAGGRFSYGPEVCRMIADALRDPRPPVAPAFPMPAGGIRAENAGEVLGTYGRDTILLVGGGLLGAPDREALLERSRQFVRAVHDFRYPA